VFLLGLNLIDIILKKNRNDLSDIFKFSNREQIYQTWLMTSAVHDYGYPLEAAQNIISSLSSLYKKLYLVNISNTLNSLTIAHQLKQELSLLEVDINKNRSRVNEKFKIELFILDSIKSSLNVNKAEARRIVKKLRDADNHGYVSAVILCHTMLKQLCKRKSFKSVKSDWTYKSLKLAAGGISLHALKIEDKNVINEIDFVTNPYSYLLFLLDNVQEWSRNIVSSDKWSTYTLTKFER
jgi:hypothetical protein